MYIPKHFDMPDQHEAVNFMQQYSFATLVSIQNNIPVATHLPFVEESGQQQVRLLSHFAKANSQANQINDQEVLVIFAQPHAYISPAHYDKQQNVPTWNYIAVHAYGKLKPISNKEEVLLLLQQMINTFEPQYLKQWQSLDPDYQHKMINGISAFEIEINKIEGKKKLSQNRSQTEKESIINTLSKSGESNQQDIAAFMAAASKINLPA